MRALRSGSLRKERKHGSAIILTALFLVVIIPIIGLAVDGANVYLMNNQVNSAVAAAVLAGTRSLSTGETVDQQRIGAQNLAQAVFNADISGIPGLALPSANCTSSTNVSSCFTVLPDDKTHLRKVQGVVTANLPVMLLGLMHVYTVPVSMTLSASRRDVNIMMVLDHSAGMAYSTALSEMKNDANAFVRLFANGRDNIGLVTFTGAPYLAAPLPNKDFLTSSPSVPDMINSVTVPMTSYLNTAAALSVAYEQLHQLNEPGALNVIVLFTDGIPGAFTGDFAPYLATGQTICSTSQSPLVGVLYTNPRETLYGGFASPNWQTATDNPPPDTIPAPGCNTIGAGLITYMPSSDYFGNSTTGAYTINNNSGGYYGDGTLNVSTRNITGASVNAFDAAASRIRGDTSIQPVIYAIGLTVNPAVVPPDPTLMKRITNDPNSAYFNPSQPSGQYIEVPTPGALQTAFISIASQVLKLAAN